MCRSLDSRMQIVFISKPCPKPRQQPLWFSLIRLSSAKIRLLITCAHPLQDFSQAVFSFLYVTRQLKYSPNIVTIGSHTIGSILGSVPHVKWLSKLGCTKCSYRAVFVPSHYCSFSKNFQVHAVLVASPKRFCLPFMRHQSQPSIMHLKT